MSHPSATLHPVAPASAATLTRRLVRSADQLDLTIELIDSEVVDGTIEPIGPQPAIRLTFGSQHTAERTYDGETPVPPTTGIDHVAAAPSVVVVPLVAPIQLTVDAVLGLLASTDGITGRSSTAQPDGTVTAIEVPSGLWLSPTSPTRVFATHLPFTVSGTSEVWAARLERVDSDGNGRIELAAIAASPTDVVATRVPDFEARDAIVENSTTDTPLTARRLWLTPSGAFTVVRGRWESGKVTRYVQNVVAGRDVHVEVVSTGYLLPFGHRAAVTEKVERTMIDDAGGGDTAILQVERFLTVVEPEVAPPADLAQHGGRALPFATLTAAVDEATPITLSTLADDGGPIEGVSDIRALDSDVVVEYLCTDRNGDRISLTLPATFIAEDVAHNTGPTSAAARAAAVATAPDRLGRREVDLRGQRVAYADPLAKGQTSKATHRFRLRWEVPADSATEADLRAAAAPAIFGALEDADVVHEMAGSATGEAGAIVTVTPHRRWLQFGNDAVGNFDLSFLDLAEPVSSLIGGDSAISGVGQFDLLAEVFNQSAGIGLDLQTPFDEFDPEALLGEASKIIGNIALSRVIKSVQNAVPGVDIPGTTVSFEDGAVVVRFTYCPSLKDLPAVGFRTVPDETKCCLHMTAKASLDDSIEASFETEVRVDNFFFDFPPLAPTPVVVVDFESVVATISSDGSTAVVPTIRSWDFSGAISMLMQLVDKLGFGNVDLKVLAEVIDMDSSVNLPDLSLGVAEIKNFAINLGLDLPLGDGPGAVSVGIGSKASPLDIDILMFGATFYLDINLGFSGLEPPSSATSIGVSVYWEILDFNIVVVHISFALRLSANWKLADSEVIFTGAVSLEGEIEVLGLVSVSASIVASLRYEAAPELMVLKGTVNYCVDSFLGKLTGGSIPIGRTEIEMGDGAQSIAPPNARRLAGAPRGTATAGGSASFADRWPEPVWADYCNAFG